MSNTTDKTPVQILESGLLYLQENGWRRGYMGYQKPGDQCRSCALGALYAGAEVDVMSWQTEDDNVRDAVLALRLSIPAQYTGIEQYNDEVATGKRDIEQVFQRAIKVAAVWQGSGSADV